MLDFLPTSVENLIEFDKIRAVALGLCFSPLSKSFLEEEKPSTNFNEIRIRLEMANEAQKILDSEYKHPAARFNDVLDCSKKLEIENVVLTREDLTKILENIELSSAYRKFLSKKDLKELFPLHTKAAEPFLDWSDTIKTFRRVFDENYEVRDSASIKLGEIRKKIRKKLNELDKQFSRELKSYASKGLLTDNPESVRFGRRVLSLPAENKRKVHGTIQGESSSGKTVFIEPQTVSLLNNEIADLKIDEQNEIYEIFKALCSDIRPLRFALSSEMKSLTMLDVYRVKASLGIKMSAVLPKMTTKAEFDLKKAHHPYLLMKNLADNKETVPFDLYLDRESRFLLLSGPNAGGKTITLKAVGLLQWMFQCAYLVPVAENSTLGVFKQIYVEIGDQQSIEDELSTYSSRLTSMKQILSRSKSTSLILIDEFGSGTDPRIGGAIAEALLEDLLNKRSIGLITTHYDNLKKFAMEKNGIVNGSMLFDMKMISPTYQLRVGKPGSSYGLEIAQRIGLPEPVINRAKKLVGKRFVKAEDLLNNIEKDRKNNEDLAAELESKKLELDRMIKQYQNMFSDVELTRKRLKLEKKQHEALKTQSLSKAIDKELNALISSAKKPKSVEKLALTYKRKNKEVSSELENLKEDFNQAYDKNHASSKLQFEVGAFVRLKEGNSQGEIIELIDKSKVLVNMGGIRLETKRSDLIVVKTPLDIKSNKSVKVIRDSITTFDNKLDIRGYHIAEAQKILQAFFDRALLSGSSNMKILHGTGTGALRKLVRKLAREFNFTDIYHPPKEEGGEGVTKIEI